MKRFVAILIALLAGALLGGAVMASIEPSVESSTNGSNRGSELFADVMVQINCARTYNSDLKLPSVPSVVAPQYVEQSLRNESSPQRRVAGTSEVKAAGEGRCYISTKPLFRLYLGGSPSEYAIRMLCRLII